ncbi:MAG: four helix bundle protein [Rhodoferax sp.]|nr:four helix bundle protein [Rhodoferax sp.]
MTAPARQGPRYRQLPLWRDATQLAREIENAVRQFPRYHKYVLGSDLRRQAMNVCRRVARAAQCDDTATRTRQIEQLVWQVEDLKMTLQLAKEVEAFASFAQFQRLVELIVALGKQSGGLWKRARSAAQAASHPGGA